MLTVQNIKPGKGAIETIKWRCVNRVGAVLALGDLVMLDLEQADAGTTGGGGPGNATGLTVVDASWVNVIDPTAPGTVLGHVYGVVVDLLDGAGADDSDVEVLFQGYVSAKTKATMTPNLPLMPGATAANNELILYADAAGTRPIAYASTTQDTNATAALSVVLFLGFAGMIGGNNT